ncbi:MAG: phosphonate C-P lyase system protein PhnH [Hyphomicrobiales bacterium]
MTAQGLQPGFKDPVHEAQATFRAVLSAISRPGEILPIAAPTESPAPLRQAMAAVLLTLADYDTGLWLSDDLQNPDVRDYLTFHCGCRLVTNIDEANFVVCQSLSAMPALADLAQGTPDYPDRSATLVIGMQSFKSPGLPARLTGPGIATSKTIETSDFDRHFWSQAQLNAEQFPLGVDFIFCTDDAVMALPRSTKIEV